MNVKGCILVELPNNQPISMTEVHRSLGFYVR